MISMTFLIDNDNFSQLYCNEQALCDIKKILELILIISLNSNFRMESN